MKQAPLLEVDPLARRPGDFYRTPAWQTRALLRRCDHINPRIATVLEPCAGDGAIVREIREHERVLTNEPFPRPGLIPRFSLDARLADTWTALRDVWGSIGVVVTNPPFDVALPIVQHAYDHAWLGVAMLLRLSWLEPTEERGPWLAAHPPTRLIVLPRYAYRGTGQTDSVTSAWVLWAKASIFCSPGVDVVTKDEQRALERAA